jgi:hypothetical protein
MRLLSLKQRREPVKRSFTLSHAPVERRGSPLSCHHERGTTLMETLVSLLMFSVVGMGIVGVSTHSLRELSLESRATLETFELKRGLDILSTELRMSSMLSPYLPGTVESASNCTAEIEVTATTLKFFVAVDDVAAVGTGGLQPYYVGYRYDPVSRELLRGEIPVDDLFSCDVSVGDPTTPQLTRPVASNVVTIDRDGNGTNEDPFAWANGFLTVNLATSVEGGGSQHRKQPFSTGIHRRVL